MRRGDGLSNFKKIIIGLISSIVLIAALGFGYVYYKLNSIYVSDDVKPSGVNNEKDTTVKGITNILLIGKDARNLTEKSRSDSMMILTIDNVNKGIKLTSLARDTLASIPGRGEEKLTHAYAYGEEELLLQTVEENFDVNIDYYVTVNFFSLMNIIETIGGVEVNVEAHELEILNKSIPGHHAMYYKNRENKKPVELISSTGVHNLNGYQALAYSRIRYSDSAYARDERQREVVQAIANKLSSTSVTKYPEVMNSILPYVNTNIKPTEIVKLAFTSYKIGLSDIKELEFPVEEYRTGGKLGNKGWVIQWNKEKNLNILHDFIFKNIEYKAAE